MRWQGFGSCRWRRLARLCAMLAALGTAGAACADEIRLLSAGAVEPGLRPALAAFERASGHTVRLAFATAPQIRERAGKNGDAGVAFDVVIAPPAVLDALAADAKIAADRMLRVTLGGVGIGVAVRAGTTAPDISTTAAFAQALREAERVIYNRASTGLYVETLLQREGIDVAAKTVRYPDGASVAQHVLRGQGREIGLGASTELLLVRDQGLTYVGPLPAAWQNTTLYQATLAAAPAHVAAARALLAHLASAESRAVFNAAGIEPAR